ncbi:hypothetical protein AB2L27_16230 [Kineococcus sp. LSe6-4]|uniref:AtpZ/AtpI family protein n=1 Tax=Kineococcus halophytocola TaxID=3234027 RepID=A0ABV4H5F3_9ACTN
MGESGDDHSDDAPRAEDGRPVGENTPVVRSDSDVAWNSMAYLLSGLLFGLGGGIALDAWWGTSFMTPTLTVLGLASTVYYVWFRYGSR